MNVETLKLQEVDASIKISATGNWSCHNHIGYVENQDICKSADHHGCKGKKEVNWICG